MSDPIPLDLVILHDSIDYFLSSIFSRYIQERFDILPRKREEFLLGSPEKFSSRVEQGSLVYVHGGRLANHRNFDRLLEISDKRQDLKWIVEFDPLSEAEEFSSPERYAQYRALPSLTEIGIPDVAARLKEEKICAHVRGAMRFLGYLTQEGENSFTKYLELIYLERSA
ncbi:MAG: hypothetical protein WCV90_08035 [Candidatus Woesearchaeota archaeon]|jgi:hypothetical protein